MGQPIFCAPAHGPRFSRISFAALFGMALVAAGCGPAVQASSGAEVVALEGALDSPLVHADADTEIIARVHMTSVAPPEPKHVPVNVALVIDTSGSMEGKPIEDARAASLAFVEQLHRGDRLAVVVFNSKTDIILPSTELDDDSKHDLKKALVAMRAEGTTDLVGGLQAGLAEVDKHREPHGINRVVLLGDGVPNVDSGLREMAAAAGGRGVAITSLGLGPDYDETLMGALAQSSGGRFHYVEDSTKVAGFFKDEVLRLQGAVAKNAVVALTPGPGVRIVDVIGRPSTPFGRGVHVPLGDFARGETHDLFVRLAVDHRRDGAPIEVLDAVVEFDDPIAGEHLERRVFMGAHATNDTARIAKQHNAKVESAAALSQAAATTLQAIEFARRGDQAQAKALLTRGADEAETKSRETGTAALLEQAKSMRALRGDLPRPVTPPAAQQQAPAPQTALPSPRAQHETAAAASVPLFEPAPDRVRKAHDSAFQQVSQ